MNILLAMKLPRFPLVSCLPFLAAGALSAQIASDDAGNYASWTDGTDQGVGFGPWTLTENTGGGVFAGFFLGDSTAGAGDINTGGQSFGMFANPNGAVATAERDFDTPMVVGDTFSVQLALDEDNGNKGFNLFDGTGGQLFNFNVGSGAQINTAFDDNPVTAQYNDGGAAVIDIVIDYAALNELTYTVSRSSPQGFQGVLFDGSITDGGNPFASAPASIELYNTNTASGAAENNLYFNSLEVVPEPSSAALVAAVGVLFLSTVCRRRQG